MMSSGDSRASRTNRDAVERVAVIAVPSDTSAYAVERLSADERMKFG